MLTLFIAACASPAPRIKYNPPPIPAEPKMESVQPDKNDKTGEPGFWISQKDAKADLTYRSKLYHMIKELLAYWGKSHG